MNIQNRINELRVTCGKGVGDLSRDEVAALAVSFRDPSGRCSAHVDGDSLMFVGPDWNHTMYWPGSNAERLEIHFWCFVDNVRDEARCMTKRLTQRAAAELYKEFGGKVSAAKVKGSVSFGIADGLFGRIRGVATLRQKGGHGVIVQLVTDGFSRAASALHRAAKRIAAALGFNEIVDSAGAVLYKTALRKRVTRQIEQAEAFAFVAKHHRHHQPPRGHVFSVGAFDEDGQLRGVAVVGRPVARGLDNGRCAEVTRVATDGLRNACSRLYAMSRAGAAALGFTSIITYTLPCEGGASLRASGWQLDGQAGGGSWDCASRPRTDKAPTDIKHRWSLQLA